MTDDKALIKIHPVGEREWVREEIPGTATSVDTFGGKIQVK